MYKSPICSLSFYFFLNPKENKDVSQNKRHWRRVMKKTDLAPARANSYTIVYRISLAKPTHSTSLTKPSERSKARLQSKGSARKTYRLDRFS